MPTGGSMDIGQLAVLIQLGKAGPGVDEKDFALLIHHDAGARMGNRCARRE